MSIWLSVYCRTSVAAITTADLARALDLPDPHLEAEVYGIEDDELGFEHLADMGLVFSLACARAIAEHGDGYLQDQDGLWWDVVDGRWHRIGSEV
jgi:hypothetical protein